MAMFDILNLYKNTKLKTFVDQWFRNITRQLVLSLLLRLTDEGLSNYVKILLHQEQLVQDALPVSFRSKVFTS